MLWLIDNFLIQPLTSIIYYLFFCQYLLSKSHVKELHLCRGKSAFTNNKTIQDLNDYIYSVFNRTGQII